MEGQRLPADDARERQRAGEPAGIDLVADGVIGGDASRRQVLGELRGERQLERFPLTGVQTGDMRRTGGTQGKAKHGLARAGGRAGVGGTAMAVCRKIL